MKILAAVAVLIVMAVPALAQEDRNAFRRNEIGWNIVSYSRQGAINSFGGDLSFTRYSSERFGIVGELALHERTTTKGKQTTTAYRFGPRFILKQGKRMRVFGEVLAGGSRTNKTVSFVAGTPASPATSANGFAVAVGGGVDVAIRPWLAVRAAELDYSLFRISGGTSSGMRVGAGVVFRFGK